MTTQTLIIDSDALFALDNPVDPNHLAALSKIDEINKLGIPIFITNFVVYETATLFSYRISQQKAKEFVKKIYESDFHHVFVNESLAEKSMAFFLSQNKKRTSFIDCVNWIVMAELEIEKIFSFDKFYKERLFTAGI